MEEQILHRRKKYFIDRKFQAVFILRFCLLVVFGAVISGFVIYFMSRSTVTTSFENSRLVIKSTADYILPAVMLGSALVIVFIGVAAIGVTLFTSHRIAGPLYRIEKDVQEVASGNLKKTFDLRHTDEIRLLAESLNQMTASLRGRVNTVKSSFEELEKALARAENTLGVTLPEGVKDKISEIRKEMSKLES
jgi:methyl-accepting chemotaxis protein